MAVRKRFGPDGISDEPSAPANQATIKEKSVRTLKIFTITFVIAFTSAIAACQERKEHGPAEGRGEHSEGSEHAEEGEESGERLGIGDTWDRVRGNGARLILSYDQRTKSFRGSVQNTRQQTLFDVRVEVHLSNGTELGPTKPTSLKPGQRTDVLLPAEGQSFTWWSTHPNHPHALANPA